MSIVSLEQTIESLYGIQIDSITNVRSGYTNRNFLIRSCGRTYIARITQEHRVSHIPFESYILEFLSHERLGFAIPRKIKAKSERDFVRIGDEDVITLFDFIPGYQASDLWRHPFHSTGFTEELGSKIGVLHSALSRIQTHTTLHTLENLVESYLKKFEQYENEVSQIEKMLPWQRMFLNNIDMFREEITSYIGYPQPKHKEVAHTDLRLQNILINRNRTIVGIIDFDDAVVGYHAYDLAKILVEVYTNREHVIKNVQELVDVRGFAEFINKYIKKRGIKNEEIIPRTLDLLKLPAIHNLSIVGRDPNFDEDERLKNMEWNSNIIQLFRDESNIRWIAEELKNYEK